MLCNQLFGSNDRVIDVSRCDSSGEAAFPNTDVCQDSSKKISPRLSDIEITKYNS